jgi:hypothetical protein
MRFSVGDSVLYNGFLYSIIGIDGDGPCKGPWKTNPLIHMALLDLQELCQKTHASITAEVLKSHQIPWEYVGQRPYTYSDYYGNHQVSYQSKWVPSEPYDARI